MLYCTSPGCCQQCWQLAPVRESAVSGFHESIVELDKKQAFIRRIITSHDGHESSWSSGSFFTLLVQYLEYPDPSERSKRRRIPSPHLPYLIEHRVQSGVREGWPEYSKFQNYAGNSTLNKEGRIATRCGIFTQWHRTALKTL